MKSDFIDESDRERRERMARGEPTGEELIRFILEVLESPIAPAGYVLSRTHKPQTDEQMQAENPEGGRFCMTCCLLVEVKKGVTMHGAGTCDGPHDIRLGDDDRLHRIPTPGGAASG